jgi:hypothetical protein
MRDKIPWMDNIVYIFVVAFWRNLSRAPGSCKAIGEDIFLIDLYFCDFPFVVNLKVG